MYQNQVSVLLSMTPSPTLTNNLSMILNILRHIASETYAGKRGYSLPCFSNLHNAWPNLTADRITNCLLTETWLTDSCVQVLKSIKLPAQVFDPVQAMIPSHKLFNLFEPPTIWQINQKHSQSTSQKYFNRYCSIHTKALHWIQLTTDDGEKLKVNTEH